MVKPLILSATILASVLTSTWSSSLLFGSASLAQDLDRCSPPKVFQQAAEANFYPNTIRQGNSFAPEDGYEWGYPEDPAKKVFRVIRVPHGTPSRLHPNTVWTGDGKLLPANGRRKGVGSLFLTRVSGIDTRAVCPAAPALQLEILRIMS